MGIENIRYSSVQHISFLHISDIRNSDFRENCPCIRTVDTWPRRMWQSCRPVKFQEYPRIPLWILAATAVLSANVLQNVINLNMFGFTVNRHRTLWYILNNFLAVGLVYEYFAILSKRNISSLWNHNSLVLKWKQK